MKISNLKIGKIPPTKNLSGWLNDESEDESLMESVDTGYVFDDVCIFDNFFSLIDDKIASEVSSILNWYDGPVDARFQALLALYRSRVNLKGSKIGADYYRNRSFTLSQLLEIEFGYRLVSAIAVKSNSFCVISAEGQIWDDRIDRLKDLIVRNTWVQPDLPVACYGTENQEVMHSISDYFSNSYDVDISEWNQYLPSRFAEDYLWKEKDDNVIQNYYLQGYTVLRLYGITKYMNSVTGFNELTRYNNECLSARNIALNAVLFGWSSYIRSHPDSTVENYARFCVTLIGMVHAQCHRDFEITSRFLDRIDFTWYDINSELDTTVKWALSKLDSGLNVCVRGDAVCSILYEGDDCYVKTESLSSTMGEEFLIPPTVATGDQLIVYGLPQLYDSRSKRTEKGVYRLTGESYHSTGDGQGSDFSPGWSCLPPAIASAQKRGRVGSTSSSEDLAHLMRDSCSRNCDLNDGESNYDTCTHISEAVDNANQPESHPPLLVRIPHYEDVDYDRGPRDTSVLFEYSSDSDTSDDCVSLVEVLGSNALFEFIPREPPDENLLYSSASGSEDLDFNFDDGS
jgi:hypothetical protein